MNLSNKTDQWRGKFEVKAKEKQLNMLQSAEVGNEKVLCQMSRVSDPGFANAKLHGEIPWLGSNSGTSMYYLWDLRQVI